MGTIPLGAERGGCTVEKGETEVFFTSVKFPQGRPRNGSHMFRKTWFPKVTEAKINKCGKRIQSQNSHRSWALILKPSGGTANGWSSLKSLHPLCLTVTLYFCLHSSLPFFLNACPFLSIPLYIILFAQVLCCSSTRWMDGGWAMFFFFFFLCLYLWKICMTRKDTQTA